MRKRRRSETDAAGVAQNRRCHSCLSSSSPLIISPLPSSLATPLSSPSVIGCLIFTVLTLCRLQWMSYLELMHRLYQCVGTCFGRFLFWMPCLVTSPLLLFALLSPYSLHSQVGGPLSGSSIRLSSLLFFGTVTSTAANAESLSQGLHLNSFIPHFEPLYYDRHQLLQQYSRLKRSLNEQQSQIELREHKAEQKQSNRRRRRDTSSSLATLVISNPSDTDARPASNGTRPPTIDLLTSGTVAAAVNLSTASTTAFFRHNCPLPNHEHHLEDSTEKALFPPSASHPSSSSSSSSPLDHSTGSSDSWMLYDDHSSDTANAEETDPDTDAFIDILDDAHLEDSPPNVLLFSESSSPGQQQHIRLEFSAHNRLFRLQLHSNSERVFAQDAVFETASGKPISYDRGNVVRGHLEDDEDALFEGIITGEGLLDGHLVTRHDEFYIEPAHRYFPAKEGEAPRDFHSVIYSTAIVNFPNATHGAFSPLSGSRYLPLQNPFRGYYDRMLDDLDQWDLINNIQGMFHKSASSFASRRVKRSSSSSAESLDGTTNKPSWISSAGTRKLNQSRVNSNKDSVDFELRYTASQRKSSFPSSTSRMPSKAEHLRKSSVSPKNTAGGPPSGPLPGGHEHGRYWRDMDSLHYTESEPYGIKAVHPRTHWIDDQARHHDRHVVVDPKKTTCMLYLQADHLFFEKMGSEEACIESMTRHVQKVNNIYKNTDFDQDGRPDNISFLIKRIKVHTMDSLNEKEYRYPSQYGVEKFLELFSEEDYDAFCLAYMFTYRDFEGGTLGLAWTGDLKNAGGVCEKNGHYRGSLKSLNTGIVTLLNYGKHVPPIVSHVTLAHEIGHNFGSPHDPEDDHACTPGGENGNYIMFARATSGDKRNNNKFSPCSLRSINAVLNTKAKSLKGCFQEPQVAICGNEVVEEGEECDCGWEEDCKETCCFPMRTNPPPEEPPCKLRPNVICSPSQGPCCTGDCKLKVGNKCRDDNGCRTASFCNGQGPACPPSTNKANKTICNEEYVCYMGECTGSICMAYGLESCQCKQGPNDLPTKLCELCCRMPSDDSTCKSSFEWNISPYDVPDLFSKPGTPCDNYNGYCDVSQRCREVDPSSPLATLRRLLLSNESMASLKRWFNEQWFYVAVLIMISVLILLMAYKVFNNRRTGGLTKTDIMEVALEAVAKHQQEQAQQQAQAQAQQSQSSSQSANISDSVSQASGSGASKESKGASSANSTASPTSSTTVNTSASVSTQSTVVTSSTSNSSSLTSAKTTTTSALMSTPNQHNHSHNHGNTTNSSNSTNVSVQAKNSIDSQHSLLEHSNSANSYGFNTASANNGMDSSYAGSLSSYIPSQTSQSSAVQAKVSQSYLTTAVASADSSASIYGTSKSANTGHHNHPNPSSYYSSKHSSTAASAQSAALMSLQQADASGNMYNHPFSGTAHGGSLYGYTRSQGAAVNHHHHSIPSLYQPSMIYQQHPVVASGTLATQPFYDTSALAIVANQPTYGTTTAQGYHLPDPTYGQSYYYPASASRQLNYHPASTYYPSSSLYDYIPFPRPVNPNTATATTKPPPLPSMATHPTQVQPPAPGVASQKNRSIDLTGTLDSRRLYSSALEVPAYKDTANAYYDSSSGGGQTGDKGHHHHHYYYQQLYGTTGSATGTGNSSSSKFAQHYGTIHRGANNAASSSLHHHNHLPTTHTGSGASGTSGSSGQQVASRGHYQHYYPHQQHAGSTHHSTGPTGALSASTHSRQHHSSHPQLLNTTSLSVPRASATSGVSGVATSSGEPTYGTHHSSSGSSRRSHQQIYEPLAALPLNTLGHFGYLEHSNNAHPNSNIYYSTRSDVFASHHESLPPMGSLAGGGNGLHHSSSFHGHLDDFDLIGSVSRPVDDAASDSNVGVSSSGHKHSKGHGSSGWV